MSFVAEKEIHFRNSTIITNKFLNDIIGKLNNKKCKQHALQLQI